jgi:hypothetical protein
MELIFHISLIVSIILTTGVYLTGHIDERQFEKFGFIGARFLVLSYAFTYGFINCAILLNIYLKFIIYDIQELGTSIFFIFSLLVAIGIVHTDTKHSLIEYFFNISPLKKLFLKLEDIENKSK